MLFGWRKKFVEHVGAGASQLTPEATIHDGPPDEDFTVWEQRNRERKHFVCAIAFQCDNGKMKYGTGILIGPDLVLTNYHVIDECAQNRTGRAVRSLRCKFDYFRSPENGRVSHAIDVALVPNDWLIAFSELDENDLSDTGAGSTPDKLDYAVIRLARQIGLEPLGGGDDDLADVRGWEVLPSQPALPQTNDIVVVMHHPVEIRADPPQLPLRRSENRVLGVVASGLRIHHDASTAPGSSGSPCFGRNGLFVALHHGSQKVAAGETPGWNQSIPMKEIVRHLGENGHQAVLNNRPPEDERQTFSPPPRVEPVANRQRISDAISKQRVASARVLIDRTRPETSIMQSKLSQGMVHVVTCREIDRYLRFLERLTNLSLPLNAVGLQQATSRRLFLESGKVSASRVWSKESLSRPERDRPVERRIEDILEQIGPPDNEEKGWLIEIVTRMEDCSFDSEKDFAIGLAKRCTDIYSSAGLQIFLIYYEGTSTNGSSSWAEKHKQLASMWSQASRPEGAGACLTLDDIGINDLNSWCSDLNAVWKIDETDLRTKIATRFGNGIKLAMSEVEQRLETLILECVETSERAS